MKDQKLREKIGAEIISTCIKMKELDLNQGTAGNISHRVEGGMLITPSGMPYHIMQPKDIVFISDAGEIEEGRIPSSEWRFHLSILNEKPECNAVVHNHAPYATMVSILGEDFLPAVHYMIAIAGGNTVPCAEYATYGTQELCDNIAKVMTNHKACILKNHGLVTTDTTLEKALVIAEEIELVCRLYMGVKATGKYTVLPDEEIAIVLKKFGNYGLNVKHNS